MTFIVFEGGDGVGKSTQINLLSQALRNSQKQIVCTREPGGTPFAEKIRSLFKDISEDSPFPLTEMHLICAARAQHMERVIHPALDKKQIILCDRFLDSTYVYQHILGKIPKETIDSAHRYILNSIIPDLTFVLHCPWQIAHERRSVDVYRQSDRLDSLDKNAHLIINKAYEAIYENNFSYPCGKSPKRIYIDASREPNQVFKNITHYINKELGIYYDYN